MSGFTRIAERVLSRMLALLLSSICSSTLLSIYMLMHTDPARRAAGSFGEEAFLFLIGVLTMYPYVLIWIVVAYIFLGMATLVFIKLKKAATWLDYALGGTFVAAASWFVARTIESGRRSSGRNYSEPFFAVDLLIVFIIAGFLSGLIYWLLVHRKRVTVSAPSTARSE